MNITYLTCPKCEDEIEFEVESESDDYSHWYNAGICAPEYQKDCKCTFTDEEIEAMETEVADDYRQTIYED